MISIFQAKLNHECYLLDPETAKNILELLVEIRNEINSILEYTSMNKQIKSSLGLLSDRSNTLLYSVDATEFDAAVHRAMMGLSGISPGEFKISMEQSKRLTLAYQRAAEEYVMNHRKRGKN